MAATATAVARRRRNALLMRAIVIFMKTVLVVLCVPQTLALCLKILQKLFTSGRRVASSPLENISTVCNCNSFYRIRLFIFNYPKLSKRLFISINLSEYDFKNRSNTDCDPNGGEFSTLKDAQEECKNEKRCQGVIIGNGNDTNKYTLCPTNATTSFGNHINTILSEKIIIGKIFSNQIQNVYIKNNNLICY